jgi:hypothetical protein
MHIAQPAPTTGDRETPRRAGSYAALHPGVIGTKLLRAGFGMGGAPVEQGARTSVYLATSEAVEGVSGRYFIDCRETKPSRQARDQALAEGLWRESERLLTAFL